MPVLVAGLNEPQAFNGVHVHLTPELVVSFVTTAVSVAVAPGFSDVGGAGFNETEIAAEALIVMFAEADADVLFTAVAVIVTEPPAGIAVGAV